MPNGYPKPLTQTVVADSGVENVNAGVDPLMADGVVQRMLAQVEVSFSNSMIEAFRRSVGHEWLYLHSLENFTLLEQLMGFCAKGFVTRFHIAISTSGQRPLRPRRDLAHVEKPRAAAYTELVTSATKKILDDALALPEKEREALVEALSDSLDPETIELHPDWTNEIRNRIAQIESGEAKTIPWDEVDARIKKSLTRK